jgi:hypothetical protein
MTLGARFRQQIISLYKVLLVFTQALQVINLLAGTIRQGHVKSIA